MPIAVTGLQNLQRFQRKIDDAVRGKLAANLAIRVGAALVKTVADEFKQSIDPYGQPWAPVQRNRRRDRKARNRRIARGLAVRSDKPLIDTGRLRGSLGFTASGGQVRVFLSANYASYHDLGTRRIKRRQILPDAGNLGKTWSAAIDKEARRVVADHFKR